MYTFHGRSITFLFDMHDYQVYTDIIEIFLPFSVVFFSSFYSFPCVMCTSYLPFCHSELFQLNGIYFFFFFFISHTPFRIIFQFSLLHSFHTNATMDAREAWNGSFNTKRHTFLFTLNLYLKRFNEKGREKERAKQVWKVRFSISILPSREYADTIYA